MAYSDTKVFSIGGSRNIGYHSSVRLLDKGATVTFLLRSPSVFAENKVIQKYVKDGKVRIVEGDALVKSDVAKAWKEAVKGEGREQVDILLFTVGATPKGGQGKFQLTKGIILTPANLVTQCLLNALITLPPTSSQPKIITISSTGVTKKSHNKLPLLLKPLYGYLLAQPHRDKSGAERLAAHCAGWEWEDGEVGEDILAKGWQDTPGLPTEGSLKNIVVIRPALLLDGNAKSDNTEGKRVAYRVQEGDFSGWTVNRRDVAHFVVEGALANWNNWQGKCVSIAY